MIISMTKKQSITFLLGCSIVDRCISLHSKSFWSTNVLLFIFQIINHSFPAYEPVPKLTSCKFSLQIVFHTVPKYSSIGLTMYPVPVQLHLCLQAIGVIPLFWLQSCPLLQKVIYLWRLGSYRFQRHSRLTSKACLYYAPGPEPSTSSLGLTLVLSISHSNVRIVWIG